MAKFILYTKPGCGFCVKAKQLLARHGFEYEERVVGSDWPGGQVLEHCTKLKPSARIKTVPQIIYVNGDSESYIGGYQELSKSIERF